MAIDYGTKRIGVAVTDPLKIIASGLETVANADIYDYLAEYLKNEQVECIVVGDPQRSDGSESPIKHLIVGFMRKLKKEYPDIKITSYNERYSSQRAEETIRMSGAKKKKRQNKALVDTVSAAIILKDYMEEYVW